VRESHVQKASTTMGARLVDALIVITIVMVILGVLLHGLRGSALFGF
jgi:hypothetical protein